MTPISLSEGVIRFGHAACMPGGSPSSATADSNSCFCHCCECDIKASVATALSNNKQVFGMFLFLRFSYIFLFFGIIFIWSFRASSLWFELFHYLLQGPPLFWHDFILRPKSRKTCLILDKAVHADFSFVQHCLRLAKKIWLIRVCVSLFFCFLRSKLFAFVKHWKKTWPHRSTKE